MKANIRITGDKELEAALRALPRDLSLDAERLILAAADTAAAEIRAAYPEVTGNLKGGVRVVTTGSEFATRSRVISSAPHAHLFEYGTEARQTSLGYDRGGYPGRHVFWPIVERWQKALKGTLIDLVKATGLRVTDHAA
jgi:Bacteriophage HK97-gp10, putative tail-component